MWASSCAVSPDVDAPDLGRHRGGLDEQQVVAVRHGARILHRAVPVLRHADEVELVERDASAEPLLERGQDRWRLGHGQSRHPAVIPHRHHARRHRGPGNRHRLERSHGERHEIARQRRRAPEGPGASPVLVALRLDWGVREHQRACGGGDAQLIGDLELGLVPARERTAGIDGLELREQVVRAVVCHPVEPHALRVEAPREVDLQDVRPGSSGLVAVSSTSPRSPRRVANSIGRSSARSRTRSRLRSSAWKRSRWSSRAPRS